MRSNILSTSRVSRCTRRAQSVPSTFLIWKAAKRSLLSVARVERDSKPSRKPTTKLTISYWRFTLRSTRTIATDRCPRKPLSRGADNRFLLGKHFLLRLSQLLSESENGPVVLVLLANKTGRPILWVERSQPLSHFDKHYAAQTRENALY